ncbi:MAG: hypothetical protein MI810_10855 [Flavobacteriales bacterium]|nr:hypothetical protein [Flavobacteriales bacterium]
MLVTSCKKAKLVGAQGIYDGTACVNSKFDDDSEGIHTDIDTSYQEDVTIMAQDNELLIHGDPEFNIPIEDFVYGQEYEFEKTQEGRKISISILKKELFYNEKLYQTKDDWSYEKTIEFYGTQR